MPQQVRKPDIHAPSLLTRLARDNRRMGIRLAQLEFRELRAELANPSVFDLQVQRLRRRRHCHLFWIGMHRTAFRC